MSRQAADNPQRHEKIDKKLFYEGFLATNGIICGQLQTWKIREEGSKITFTIRAPANKYIFDPRSCKRREILFQKSLLSFSTWREYFYSQPTHFSSQPKK